MSGLTRRAALGAALGFALPAYAGGRIEVDVSPLRRDGDNADADYLAHALPAYLAQYVGPGHNVRVRIDSVTYGAPGSNGSISDGAVDWIEGEGSIDGRSAPLTCSQVVDRVALPDPTNYFARQRQDNLARAFAQWLPRQTGF